MELIKNFGMNISKITEERKLKPLKELPLSVEELCDRYEKLTTCIVSDVLREEALLDQALPRILPIKHNMKVAGIAFTVKGSKNVMIEEGIQEFRAEIWRNIHENSVVVIDTGGANEDDNISIMGGVTARTIKQRGCKGAVVDGGSRDTYETLALNFPIFCKYRSPNALMGRWKFTHYQVLIKIGNVFIRPGDIVFGDIDGVIIIPRDIAYKVLVRAEEIVRIERKLIKWVDEGLDTSEIVKRGGYF